MFSARCQVPGAPLLLSDCWFPKEAPPTGKKIYFETGQQWLLILLKTWLWGMAQGQNWKTIDTKRQLINPVWQVPVMCFHLSSFSWLPIVSRHTAVPWRLHAFFLQGSSTCTCWLCPLLYTCICIYMYMCICTRVVSYIYVPQVIMPWRRRKSRLRRES